MGTIITIFLIKPHSEPFLMIFKKQAEIHQNSPKLTKTKKFKLNYAQNGKKSQLLGLPERKVGFSHISVVFSTLKIS